MYLYTWWVLCLFVLSSHTISIRIHSVYRSSKSIVCIICVKIWIFIGPTSQNKREREKSRKTRLNDNRDKNIYINTPLSVIGVVVFGHIHRLIQSDRLIANIHTAYICEKRNGWNVLCWLCSILFWVCIGCRTNRYICAPIQPLILPTIIVNCHNELY